MTSRRKSITTTFFKFGMSRIRKCGSQSCFLISLSVATNATSLENHHLDDLALSKKTSIQSTVKIVGDYIADLLSRTDGQLTGTGLTFFNNTVSVQGKLKQNSSGFNVGYCILAGCDTSVSYNFGTDYGVYMISFSVNKDRYWTISSYVHVLRTVSRGSFIIPLFQGNNEMNQSIDTGTKYLQFILLLRS